MFVYLNVSVKRLSKVLCVKVTLARAMWRGLINARRYWSRLIFLRSGIEYFVT